MHVNLVEIIRIIILFQLAVFSAFLFFGGKSSRAGTLLGIHLCSQSMGAFSQLFSGNRFLFDHYTHLSFIGYPFMFLWGPTFYFYVRAFAFSDFRFRRRHLLHAVPFFAAALVLTLTYYFRGADEKKTLASSLFIVRNQSLVLILLNAQILAYDLASLHVLKRYSDRLKQSFSSTEKINLNWLKWIVTYFVLAHLASIAVSFGWVARLVSPEPLMVADYLIYLIFFNVIFFRSWSRQDVFTGVDESVKYKSSTLTPTEARGWIEKLNRHIERDKPYLNPDLTIDQLAAGIGISPRMLSQLVNEYFNKNFYDYISGLRIDEAKKIFGGEGRDRTILEIIYATGYNSKSAFNTAFKRNTGLTPSEFRKTVPRPEPVPEKG